MLRALLLTTAAVALTAAGCTTSRPATSAPSASVGTMPDAPSAMGDTLVVELSHSVQKDGHTIRFDDIPEDSRCPVNTTCVWEGRATLALTIDGAPHTLTVPHGGARPDEVSRVDTGGVSVEAVALTPLPGTGLGREAMRAHLVVKTSGGR